MGTTWLSICLLSPLFLLGSPLGSAPALPTTSAGLLPPSPQGQQGVPPLPRDTDGWSQDISLRAPDGWYATAVHGALLPDGRVAFIGYERQQPEQGVKFGQRTSAFCFTPVTHGAPIADTVVIENEVQPLDIDGEIMGNTLIQDDLFCTGNTLTAEGELFTAGGMRSYIDLGTLDLTNVGMPYATLFDGTNWTRVAEDMIIDGPSGQPRRWYAAATRLPDSRILVMGGFDVVFPGEALNLSAECWDPVTGQWTQITALNQVPYAIHNVGYPAPFVLPSPVSGHDLLIFGHNSKPVLLDLDGTPSWNVLANARPGMTTGQRPNIGAGTAPLPIRLDDGEWGYANGSMIMAGGDHNTPHMRYADVYDPVADSWLPRIDIGTMRHHSSAVLLPTGVVMVTGGHNQIGDDNIKRAGYIDPADGFRHRFGVEVDGDIRGYHNVALLLPDGRVLVAGGTEPTGEYTENSSLRYHYPPYMGAERPSIVSAPQTITMNQGFSVSTEGKRPREAVLMGLGVMTHSYDFNQRYVQIELTNTTRTGTKQFDADLVAPPDGRTAPPGYYMLFILDRKRIPSESVMVKLVD